MPHRLPPGLARPSRRALLLLGALFAAFLWTFADAALLRARRAPARAAEAAWTARAGLTDLCLFPEARFTRHLSQADRHAPFQDAPGAYDHFPAASLAAPPATLLSAPTAHRRRPHAPRP